MVACNTNQLWLNSSKIKHLLKGKGWPTELKQWLTSKSRKEQNTIQKQECSNKNRWTGSLGLYHWEESAPTIFSSCVTLLQASNSSESLTDIIWIPWPALGQWIGSEGDGTMIDSSTKTAFHKEKQRSNNQEKASRCWEDIYLLPASALTHPQAEEKYLYYWNSQINVL
jgi:hypothetical protein